jgi:hypothetical protein
MTSLMLALAAASLSTICILLLCAGDPKRRRVSGSGGGLSQGHRRLLSGGACLPGVWCALQGDGAALLVWLGACALAGWLAAAGSSRTYD